MKVYANFPHELPERPEYPVVTIGVFDGVHRGHQRLLEVALGAAASRPVAVVTFDPHPRAVLGPVERGRLLTPIEERLELLGAWPVAAIAVLRFDLAIARQPYGDFVRGALVQGLGARVLVLGHDVHLGYERQGTPERLAELGRKLGYEVVVVPTVRVGGEVLCSTLLRSQLDAGDVEAAARGLGRPYELRGTVIHGTGRGRELGVPTANLRLPAEKLVPADGVYAVRARIAGGAVAGALNIGVRPTFRPDGPRFVEVHLLDFQGDLYGRPIRLELLRRLRGERRFEAPAALLEQVRRDLAAARRAVEAG